MSLGLADQQTFRRLVISLEQRIRTFAALGRSTSVEVRGQLFDGFFPASATRKQRETVWQLLWQRPDWLRVDMVLVDGPRSSYPSTYDTIRFDLHANLHQTETNIQTFLEAGLADGSVSILHIDDGDQDDMNQAIATRIVHHSVAACSVVLNPYNKSREVAIRQHVAVCLLEQGSLAAEEQAQGFPVISLSSIDDLVDAERWHLLLVDAQDYGTVKHGQWVAWAAPLRASGILQTVDLLSPGPDCLGSCTAMGFHVAYHLSTSPHLSPAELREQCLLLSQQARRDEKRVQYKLEVDWSQVLTTITERRGTLFVLSRLAKGAERAENMAVCPSGAGQLGTTVRHAALFADFATDFDQYCSRVGVSLPVVVLRHVVAARLNLDDWLYFFACLRRHACVLVVLRDGDKQPQRTTIADFLETARPMRKPLLTMGAVVNL